MMNAGRAVDDGDSVCVRPSEGGGTKRVLERPIAQPEKQESRPRGASIMQKGVILPHLLPVG